MNFHNEYHLLLRRQVEEEINYLISKGHDTKHPPTSCTFCNDFKGYNVCNRLAHLRHFLSQIMAEMGITTIKAAQLAYQPTLPDNKLIMPLIGFSD